MLSFEPQSIEQHKAAWQRVRSRIFDVESCELGTAQLPGEVRDCVYDHADGMRLIVSVERFPDGDLAMHLSLSVWPGKALYDLVKDGKYTVAALIDRALQRYRYITGDERELELAGFSQEKGVPHLYRSITPEEVSCPSP